MLEIVTSVETNMTRFASGLARQSRFIVIATSAVACVAFLIAVVGSWSVNPGGRRGSGRTPEEQTEFIFRGIAANIRHYHYKLGRLPCRAFTT